MKTRSIIKNEVYKIFVKNYFLVIFTIVAMVSIITLVVQSDQTTFSSQKAEQLYVETIRDVSGKFSKETADQMRRDASHYYDLQEEFLQSTNNQERLEILSKNPNLYEYNTIYPLLVSQLDYVQENPSDRYMINASLWDNLFGPVNLDFIFSLVIIVFTAVVVDNEYKTNMDVINRSTAYGGNIRFFIQTITLVLGVSLLMLVIQTTKVFYLWQSVRNTIDYPIQSLPTYAGALFNTSVLGYYVLVSLAKVVGITMLVLFVSFIYIRTQSLIEAIFTGVLFTVLPFMLISYDKLRFLPIPTNWLMSENLLRGSDLINKSFNFLPFFASDFMKLLILSLLFITVISLLNHYSHRKGGGK